MTTSLSSSIDILSLTSSPGLQWATDYPSDEDEIVWSLSSSAVLSSSSPLSETADFVLVPRMNTNTSAIAAAADLDVSVSPTADPDTIVEALAALSLSAAPQARRAHGPLSPASAGSVPAKNKGRHSGLKAAAAPAHPGLPAEEARATQTPSQPVAAAPPKIKRKKAKKARSSPSSSSAARGEGGGLQNGAGGGDGVMRSSSPVAKEKKKKSPGGSSASAASQPRAEKIASAAVKGAAPPIASLAADYVTKLPTGLGSGVVVQGSLSERGGEVSESSSSTTTTTATTATGYHEAHKYMTSYLAHPPPPGNNGSALLMLQALILELGCVPSVATGKFSILELPRTLTQAKLLLKSHAFINVRDYLAVREQGQAALRRVMHPSRKSLIREVRKGKRVPVQEVKNAGLNVLLVNTRF